MTPTQIELVRQSWIRLELTAEDSAVFFYNTLFELDPELEPLFSEDLEQQGKKLMATLGRIVDLLDDLDALLLFLRELGESQVKHSVTEADYRTFVQAWLKTLSNDLGSHFDKQTKDAWVSAYIILSSNLTKASLAVADIPASNLQKPINIEDDFMSNLGGDNVAFFKSTVDQSSSASIMIDRDLIVTYVNQATLELFKKHEKAFQAKYPRFDRDKIIGSCIDSFHTIPAHQRNLLDDPSNFPWKTYISVEDLTFELNVFAITDDAGNYIGNTLEWDDLTELRQRDIQNTESSGQIEAIGKAQAVISFNMDGTIIEANDNFLGAMGYTAEELRGQHHSMFVEPEFKASIEYQQFWEKLKRGEYQAAEFKRIGKGGKEVWIQASYNPIMDMSGKPIKVVKYATDVTGQKLKNADFAGQIEAIGKSQAVIAFNMDGTIIEANDNFLDTMGYMATEVTGQHHSIFVDPEFKASIEYRQFWEKLNRGDYEAAEFKRIGKGGKEVWIQASYNPIMDMNGKPFKVVKYATDVTARKQAINQIKDVLLAMSNGDLTKNIDGTLAGEFNILGESMNSLNHNLNNMVAQIRSGATNVFSAAKEIAQGNSDLSQRTEAQAASLEETASAMEELTTTVQQNSENASEAAQLSAGVMDKATTGSEVVVNAVGAMQEIDKSSTQIADIIGVIDEIAFQTNLLALNAAVEAARAGEQGRGFAVVAAEVRNLAQRSAAAAKEIKGLIKNSVAAVGKGTMLVDETGKTFAELVKAVQEVVVMISDIASASKEQSAGITEVSQAVAQMDEITQQNAALVEEATASSKAMEEQSQELIEQVAFFQTDEHQDAIVAPITGHRASAPVASRRAAPSAKRASTANQRKVAENEKWEEF